MFPTLTIPDDERAQVQKDFDEKLHPHHDDVDGVQPYDWREDAAFREAIRLGFIKEWSVEDYFTFWTVRGEVVADPDQPGWQQARKWLLKVLALPGATPRPVLWPTFDPDAFAEWEALQDADVPMPMGGLPA